MRKIYLFILLLALSVPCTAKIKVVGRSAKKVPVWVNATEEGYIITSAITDDLEQAKNRCMDNIRAYVIDAVAQNVKSSSEGNINQETVNNEITNFLDQFTYSYQTQSANLPYLKGISISKITDSYWEKREDTDTKQISYLYAVKYPFPRVELKKLVHEFEKQDAEMFGNYKKLEEQFDDIASVEQIDRAIVELDGLIKYFFDDLRKDAAVTLKKNYQQLYNSITFKEISNELGCYVFTLVLGEKEITTSQRPTVKSSTAEQLRAEQENGQWKIFYNCEACLPLDENAISVTFRFGGKPLVNKFYIDVSQDEIDLFPTKEVYIKAGRKDEQSIAELSVKMNIEVKTKGVFTIKGITLNIPGVVDPLFFNDLKIKVTGKGSQMIDLQYEDELELQPQRFKVSLLKGYLEVENEKGRSKRVDFSLPFKQNW